MSGIPPDLAQQINAAAQELQFARKALEKARNWEEQRIAQEHFDRCQERMISVSLVVNGGLYRDSPPA